MGLQTQKDRCARRNSGILPEEARHSSQPSLEGKGMATGSGLQQPPRGVGGIKARAAASSQHRDGRTAWRKSLVRLDSAGAGSSSEQEEP